MDQVNVIRHADCMTIPDDGVLYTILYKDQESFEIVVSGFRKAMNASNGQFRLVKHGQDYQLKLTNYKTMTVDEYRQVLGQVAELMTDQSSAHATTSTITSTSTGKDMGSSTRYTRTVTDEDDQTKKVTVEIQRHGDPNQIPSDGIMQSVYIRGLSPEMRQATVKLLYEMASFSDGMLKVVHQGDYYNLVIVDHKNRTMDEIKTMSDMVNQRNMEALKRDIQKKRNQTSSDDPTTTPILNNRNARRRAERQATKNK
jgi:hypothetical protein